MVKYNLLSLRYCSIVITIYITIILTTTSVSRFVINDNALFRVFLK